MRYDILTDGVTCEFSNELSAWMLPNCMKSLLVGGNNNQTVLTYLLSNVGEVWKCLHGSSEKMVVRCPELGPSDSWGLFPTDCTNQECQSTQGWVGNAFQVNLFCL